MNEHKGRGLGEAGGGDAVSRLSPARLIKRNTVGYRLGHGYDSYDTIDSHLPASLVCRDTIHCRMYVLLILACFSASASSTST
jgi:hypothetical protein